MLSVTTFWADISLLVCIKMLITQPVGCRLFYTGFTLDFGICSTAISQSDNFGTFIVGSVARTHTEVA